MRRLGAAPVVGSAIKPAYIRTLTMEDTIEPLGGKRPAKVTRSAAAKCPECGGLIIGGFREITGPGAYLSDFERPVRYCEECNLEAPDD